MSTSDSAVPMPTVAFAAALWPFADAGSQLASNWLELQRSAWQPWLDLQYAWLEQLNEQAGFTLPVFWIPRGTEQLA